MISKREARKIAEKLVGFYYKIPSMNSLGDWRRWGLITEAIEYENKGRGGGRVAKYHNSLPIQIATAAELKAKSTYNLKEIGEIAEEMIPAIINENIDINEQFQSAIVGVDKFAEIAEKANERAMEASDPAEIRKAEEELEKAKEKMQQKYLIRDFISAWEKYEERHEKMKLGLMKKYPVE